MATKPTEQPRPRVFVSEAGRIIDRSPQGVRYLEATGRITSIRVGNRKVRTYAVEDCERLAKELNG